MTTTLYVNTALQMNVSQNTPVLLIRLPTTGLFALFGKLSLQYKGASPLQVEAFMTTFDGVTILDSTPITLAGNADCTNASMLGYVNTAVPNANEIVDIRFNTGGFVLTSGVLTAMSIDAVSSQAV
jgi:hypothetical protein